MARQKNPDKPAAPKMTVEQKHARFIEKAGPRVDRVLSSIGALAKLSRREAYDYTPSQVTQILNAIGEACEKMEKAFTTTTTKGKPGGFSFK